ncbi:hypothetical protein KIPB_009379, partial [Kipferlia bialata]|eukprot:g9379.t1
MNDFSPWHQRDDMEQPDLFPPQMAQPGSFGMSSGGVSYSSGSDESEDEYESSGPAVASLSLADILKTQLPPVLPPYSTEREPRKQTPQQGERRGAGGVEGMEHETVPLSHPTLVVGQGSVTEREGEARQGRVVTEEREADAEEDMSASADVLSMFCAPPLPPNYVSPSVEREGDRAQEASPAQDQGRTSEAEREIVQQTPDIYVSKERKKSGYDTADTVPLSLHIDAADLMFETSPETERGVGREGLEGVMDRGYPTIYDRPPKGPIAEEEPRREREREVGPDVEAAPTAVPDVGMPESMPEFHVEKEADAEVEAESERETEQGEDDVERVLASRIRGHLQEVTDLGGLVSPVSVPVSERDMEGQFEGEREESDVHMRSRVQIVDHSERGGERRADREGEEEETQPGDLMLTGADLALPEESETEGEGEGEGERGMELGVMQRDLTSYIGHMVGQGGTAPEAPPHTHREVGSPERVPERIPLSQERHEREWDRPAPRGMVSETLLEEPVPDFLTGHRGVRTRERESHVEKEKDLEPLADTSMYAAYTLIEKEREKDRETIATLQLQCSDRERDLADLRTERERERREGERRERELQALSRANETLQGEREREREEWAAKEREAKDALEQREAQLQRSITSLEANVTALQRNHRTEITNQRRELVSEIKRRDAIYQKRLVKADAVAIKLRADLERDLERASTTIRKRDETIRAMTDDHTVLTTDGDREREKTHREYLSVCARLEATQAALAEKEASVEALTTEKGDLSARHEAGVKRLASTEAIIKEERE